MRETAIAIGLFALLCLGAVLLRAATFASLGLLWYAGGFLVVAGLLFSLPCAVVYHWRLYRSLAPRGRLDARWIWNPVAHHQRLETPERRRVMPWFYAGAAGWVATILGCVLIGLAAITTT